MHLEIPGLSPPHPGPQRPSAALSSRVLLAFLDHTSPQSMRKQHQAGWGKLGQFFEHLRLFLPLRNIQRVELNSTKLFIYFFFPNDKRFWIFGYVMSSPHLIPQVLEGNFSFKVMMMLVRQNNALWELWLHLWAWPWEGVGTPTVPDAASCASPGGTHFIGKLLWLHYCALKHWSEKKREKDDWGGEVWEVLLK